MPRKRPKLEEIAINRNLANQLGNSLRDEKIAVLWWFLSRRVFSKTVNSWVNVHCKKFEQLLGRDYYKTIRDAKEGGFLVVNNRYSDGSKTAAFTKSYKFERKFRSLNGCIMFPLRYQQPATTISKEHVISIADNDKPGRFLADCLPLINVKISGVDCVDNAWNLETLNHIDKGNHFAERDEFGGRFHSTLTHLPKTYRDQIKIDSDGTTCLDIANSQPLLLGMIARDPKILKSVLLKKNKEEEKGGETDTIPYVPHYVPKFDPKQNDVEWWVSECEAGQIYETVQNLIPESIAIARTRYEVKNFKQMKRNCLKRWFLQILCDRQESIRSNPIWMTIARYFPKIADTLEALKAESYKGSSMALQSMEAELITCNIVSRHIAAGCPIATIHDEIVTPSEQLTRHLINAEFNRYGITPKLK